MAVLLAGGATASAQPDAAAPTYQRSRVAAPYGSSIPRVNQPGELDRWPTHQVPPEQGYPGRRPPNRPDANWGDNQQSPSIAAGTFQRPYPFHLDYYKQKFGGSYDPYFGNLYGPPNVVLATPFIGGGGFFPNTQFPQSPFVQSPQGGPQEFCPHCGQPLTAPAGY